MLLRFVNDSDRSIYAYEMLPPPAVDVPNDASAQGLNSGNCVANNTVTMAPKSSSQPTDVHRTCDIINDLLPCTSESNRNQSPAPPVDGLFCADEGGDRLNNRLEPCTSAPVGDVTLLESNPDVNWQYNRLSADDSLSTPDTSVNDGFVGNGLWASSLPSPSDVGCHSVGDGEQSTSADAGVSKQTGTSSSSLHPQTESESFTFVGNGLRASSLMSPSDVGCYSGRGEFCDGEESASAGKQTETPSSALHPQPESKFSAAEDRQMEDGGGDAETARVADEWKSCAICLEEMEDDHLLVHAECGGTLCPACHLVCSVGFVRQQVADQIEILLTRIFC